MFFPCCPASGPDSAHTRKVNMYFGRDILVLAEGGLHIQRDDYWGNRSILGHIGVGEIFGEAYASPESGALLNDVVAVENSSVFFFDVKRVITTCSSACRFHTLVVQNLFFAISEKNTPAKGGSLLLLRRKISFFYLSD